LPTARKTTPPHARARRSSKDAAADVAARLAGRKVVTVDLDATLYDPWACCGHRGNFGSADGCTHARVDTLALVADVCAYHDAVPVILSWRGGLVDVSKRWLAEIGFDAEAVFIPGSDDDIEALAPARGTLAQVAFKLGTVQALEQVVGATVVASFDDNADVIAALGNHGVWETYLVEHLVEVAPHEWAAGRLGAPKPKASNWPTSSRPPSWMPLPFDDAPAMRAPDECSLCGEDTRLVPPLAHGADVCGWCEANEPPGWDVPSAGDTVSIVLDDGRETDAVVQEIDSFDEVVVKTADGDLLWVSVHDLAT
jgi:hypothetical protein